MINVVSNYLAAKATREKASKIAPESLPAEIITQIHVEAEDRVDSTLKSVNRNIPQNAYLLQEKEFRDSKTSKDESCENKFELPLLPLNEPLREKVAKAFKAYFSPYSIQNTKNQIDENC